MNRTARIVCVIYGAAFLFLAYATVQQGRYGEKWAAVVLGACSLVPLIGLLREMALADAVDEAQANAERAARLRDRKEQQDLRATADALGHACCERWWTSFGSDHDPQCRNQQRSAA